jgi:hypothetical protein
LAEDYLKNRFLFLYFFSMPTPAITMELSASAPDVNEAQKLIAAYITRYANKKGFKVMGVTQGSQTDGAGV